MTNFINFIANILGTYTPNTYTDYTVDINGTVYTITRIADGLAGVDYNFIMRGLFFLVAFICIMKILGGILCKIS